MRWIKGYSLRPLRPNAIGPTAWNAKTSPIQNFRRSTTKSRNFGNASVPLRELVGMLVGDMVELEDVGSLEEGCANTQNSLNRCKNTFDQHGEKMLQKLKDEKSRWESRRDEIEKCCSAWRSTVEELKEILDVLKGDGGSEPGEEGERSSEDLRGGAWDAGEPGTGRWGSAGSDPGGSEFGFARTAVDGPHEGGSGTHAHSVPIDTGRPETETQAEETADYSLHLEEVDDDLDAILAEGERLPLLGREPSLEAKWGQPATQQVPDRELPTGGSPAQLGTRPPLTPESEAVIPTPGSVITPEAPRNFDAEVTYLPKTGGDAFPIGRARPRR